GGAGGVVGGCGGGCGGAPRRLRAPVLPPFPSPGVCMKQHKLLLKAITRAQDHGLLWRRVPFVPVPRDDFTARPPAVGKTPPAPQLAAGRAWYPWYDWNQPPPAAVARLRRLYKEHLRQEEGGPAPGGAPGAQ
ncbi:28S ribosomal protein S18b, mitochondrial, partial [Oxyura jamaicensis]|uniref:28S ribosomal protein S18b, mitochondrial n=1 Tax=Oxyura jamaicensis TaxID=8884 RepID=UPI0015A53ACF